MSSLHKIIICSMTAILISFWTSLPFHYIPFHIHATAETTNELDIERLERLLEQGLTLYEIDQELARLSKEETKVLEQITETDQAIKKQEQLVNINRQHAGKVLHAYYVGDRTSIWGLMLSVDNFNDAMTVYEYLSVIFNNDQQTLEHYLASNQALKQLKSELLDTQNQLQSVKERFLAQRQRQVELQAQLDTEITEHPEALTEIIAITDKWEKEGLPLFRSYFRSLALAMNDLPSILNDYPDILKRKGLNYTFKISDKQLNTFLRSRDETFNQLTFEFENEQIIAKGQREDIAIGLKGRYTLHNEEQSNVIRFDLDELSFQGISLPDVTKEALQQQFDLAFYPQNIAPFVRATNIEMKDGQFTVELTIALE